VGGTETLPVRRNHRHLGDLQIRITQTEQALTTMAATTDKEGDFELMKQIQ
jgi:hypothetical protein